MNGKTILFIGQCHILMTLTKKILERSGCSVSCVVGLTGAEEQLSVFHPDGIILDTELSDGNGIECCRKLRAITDAPIMFISNDKDDELSALRAGASDYLKKPYDNDVMKARIGIMLNSKTNPVAAELPESTQQIQEMIIKAGKKRKVKLYLPMAVCFTIVCALIVSLIIFNSERNHIDIPEQQVPLATLGYTDECTEPEDEIDLMEDNVTED